MKKKITKKKGGADVKSVSADVQKIKEAVDQLAQPQYGEGRKPGQIFGIIKGPMAKDSAPYSFMNVAKALRERDWTYAKGEYSIHEDLLKNGYLAPESGILIPFDPVAIELCSPAMKGLCQKMMASDAARDPSNLQTLMRQKDLAAFGSDVLGGALVAPQLASSIVELLRPLVVTERAGAQVTQLPPSGQMSIARQTTDPTFEWLGENATITDSNPAFGNINLTSKKLAGLVKMSNDSLRFTNPGIEMIVRRSLAARGAISEDQAFLAGVGTSFTPKGIINYAGIQGHTATVTDTNGNTFSFEDPSLMIGKVLAAPDPEGPTAWIMRPELWAGLQNRRADAITAADGKGAPLWWISSGDISKGIPDKLRNVPVYTTTGVSNTRVKASGTDLTYALLGNFRHALIARAGVMEMALDGGGAYFAADQVAIRCIFRTDFALLQERPFVFCDQLLNR